MPARPGKQHLMALRTCSGQPHSLFVRLQESQKKLFLSMGPIAVRSAQQVSRSLTSGQGHPNAGGQNPWIQLPQNFMQPPGGTFLTYLCLAVTFTRFYTL